MARLALATFFASISLTACGGGGTTATIYLERPGSSARPLQRVPVLAVRRRGAEVVVDLDGRPANPFDASAVLVFTLTSLPGFERVVLLDHGRPCCV